MRERILITGGLGFLGSHLVEELCKTGYEITIIDNGTSAAVGAAPLGTACNLEPVSLEYYQWDGKRFRYIYHLADVVGPARILPFGGELARRTIAGLSNVLSTAIPGYTRVVIVSSSEVYGRPGKFREDADLTVHQPYTIRLEYAVAKILAEVTALNYARSHGIVLNVIRPFNIAGPRQSSEGGFVIPRFFEAALYDEPITVFGDGRQVRSFTHVRDTVASFIAVIHSNVSGRIYNSGNPDNVTTINDLAVRVRDLCRSRSAIVHIDPKVIYGPSYAEAFDKVPNITAICEDLGWTPKRSLDSILTDVLNYYRPASCRTACGLE